jgi:predicted amidophosphoribosyltransferase
MALCLFILKCRESALKVNLREICGPWDQGWALDKHMLKSTYLGDDERGHPRFENIRTEVGEATYQLKYRQSWVQTTPLAEAIAESIFPKLKQVGFILPMPASTPRQRQPVTEVASALGNLVGLPVFNNVLLKAKTGVSLKDLDTKAEKIAAIGNGFSVNDIINGCGPWNILLVDDLIHTGASMEAACETLRTYSKVAKIYVVALTWR